MLLPFPQASRYAERSPLSEVVLTKMIKIFKKYFTLVFGFLVLTGLVRWMLYLVVIKPQAQELPLSEILYAFILGARFDLMAWGFVGLLIYVLAGLAVRGSFALSVHLARWIVQGSWLLWCVAWAYHADHYLKTAQHMKFNWLVTLDHESLALNRWQVWILLLVWILGLVYMRKNPWVFPGDDNEASSDSRVSLPRAIFQQIMIVLLLGLAARGNFLARHLNSDFANFSDFAPLNELSMGPWL